MIGIDITDLKRLDPENESFLKLVLTEDERREFDALRTPGRKREYLGGRFAAKEAIFKATGMEEWLKCSVLHDENGKPYIKDHPELAVSISHDGGMAAAVVMVVKGEES